MILLEVISYTYPWSNATSSLGGSTGLVNTFYNISLALVGVAAFGVIVYGGILYTISAGNPSKQQDAVEWITGAVYGVVLLFGAYFLLYTINPELVELREPKIEAVTFATSTEGGGSIDCTKYTASECYGYSEACDYKSQDSYTSDPTKAQPESCTNKATGSIDTELTSGDSINYASEALSALITCVANSLPGTVDRITGIYDSAGYNNCGLDTNNWKNTSGSQCHHKSSGSVPSCHYGGSSCEKSYAVDYGNNEEYATYIRDAAISCGAYFVYNESDHVHASVGGSYGCGCDNSSSVPYTKGF